jgi:hypothetical protein
MNREVKVDAHMKEVFRLPWLWDRSDS